MGGVIALFSSSRRRGNTGQFLDRIAAELEIELAATAIRQCCMTRQP